MKKQYIFDEIDTVDFFANLDENRIYKIELLKK